MTETIKPNTTEESCENCRCFDAYAPGSGHGECMRYPPRVFIDGDSSQHRPTVRESDWCGEHRMRYKDPHQSKAEE